MSKPGGKSEVWNHFEQVVDSDNICVGFVQCMKCSTLLSYDCKKTGTSSLNRHMKQACIARKDVVSLQCPLLFFCRDIRPFYVVSGQGFQAIAQQLINVGATYGRVSAQSVLPHHSTVSKACIEKADERREVLTQTFKDALKNGDIGMSMDMWTYDYRKLSYMAITCHYISDEYQLVSKTLTTAMFPIEEAKTGKNIRRELVRLLVMNLA